MNSFYDYKKNRYSVLDEVYIGKEPIKFLIKADKEDRYYILDFNDELKSSEKPLRSTFARYDSKVKYDIANLAQEISDTDLMVWEEQKLEIQMQEMSYFDNEKLQQKREEAEEAGWSELSIVDVSYYIENSVLNLSIDGKSFSIQQRIDELAFEELTSNELGDFVREWIYVYNHTIGDMTKAQTSAECEIVAQREFDKLDKSSLTQLDFTKLLVKNLDYSTKFEGWQGEKAFKMCEKLVDYMKDKEIAFASEPTLLGEFGEVGYELRDVLKYYYLYNENGRQEAVKSNIEAQATQFLDERQCLPLSATLGGEKEYKQFWNRQQKNLRECKA